MVYNTVGSKIHDSPECSTFDVERIEEVGCEIALGQWTGTPIP